jgi:hypothetical protein
MPRVKSLFPKSRVFTAEPSIKPKTSLQWPASLGFNLCVATVVGFSYAVYLLGSILDPRNLNWLTWDSAAHQLGWTFFRQDPHFHWPLTYTDRIGYPVGLSVALMDINALLAVLFKPLSPILPDPFHYLGIEALLVLVLQFFFALVLFRLLLGPDPAAVVLPSLFFLISPIVCHRFAVGHYSLSNHWLIVAALALFVLVHREPAISLRQFFAAAVTLAGISVSINPYIAFQVVLLLTTAVLALLWRRRIGAAGALVILSAMAGVGTGVAYVLGFIIPGGRGYGESGYRAFSMNLLSPIDPASYGAIFHARQLFSVYQVEGYSYLGAGVFVLLIASVLLLVLSSAKLPRVAARIWIPLFACGLVLTAMALSTKVTLGSKVLVDLDPSEKLSSYLSPLRGSGRLFWAPYYMVLAAAVGAPFLLLRRWQARALVAFALALQLFDVFPLRRVLRPELNQKPFSTPLRSPIWATLGSMHQNLMVLPAWQCDSSASPGGANGYRIFGLLAASQKMRVNGYLSARYPGAAQDFHCGRAVSDLARAPLSPDTAYVVTPAVAALIATGPTGPGKCHDLDGFLLCSQKTDFGLRPTQADLLKLVPSALSNPGFEGNDASPWAAYGDIQGGITTDHVYSGRHSLGQTSGQGTFYQDFSGLEPGRRYVIFTWVAATSGATTTAQIGVYDPATGEVSRSAILTPLPGWQLLTHSITAGRSPMRLHLTRTKGAGTVYWDDVRVYATAVTAQSHDPIPNADFEAADLEPWAAYGNIQGGLSTAHPHGGQQSLAIFGGSGTYYQVISGLQPGRQYVISAWASTSLNGASTAQMAVYDPATQAVSHSPTANPGPGWQLLTQSITPGKSNITLHLGGNPGSGTIYWDDVSIVPAEEGGGSPANARPRHK